MICSVCECVLQCMWCEVCVVCEYYMSCVVYVFRVVCSVWCVLCRMWCEVCVRCVWCVPLFLPCVSVCMARSELCPAVL